MTPATATVRESRFHCPFTDCNFHSEWAGTLLNHLHDDEGLSIDRAYRECQAQIRNGESPSLPSALAQIGGGT